MIHLPQHHGIGTRERLRPAASVAWVIFLRPESPLRWWVERGAKGETFFRHVHRATSLEGARAVLPPGLRLIWRTDDPGRCTREIWA